MRVTQEHWDTLSRDFTKIIGAAIKEEGLVMDLAVLQEDLTQIQRAGTASPEEMIAELEGKLDAAVDVAEKELLEKRVCGSGTWGPLFEVVIEGRRIREAGGGPLLSAFTSREFRQHETKDLLEFDAMRRLIKAAVDKQRQRIRSGELQPVVMSEKLIKSETARLERQIAETKAKLSDVVGVLAMFRDGGHDHLVDMMREYQSSQNKCTFPVDPLYRIQTSPAWGGITNEQHPNAAKIRLPEEHVAAWKAWRDHLAAKVA